VLSWARIAQYGSKQSSENGKRKGRLVGAPFIKIGAPEY